MQGTKVKKFEHVLVEGCNFMNCGYYDNGGGGVS